MKTKLIFILCFLLVGCYSLALNRDQEKVAVDTETTTLPTTDNEDSIDTVTDNWFSTIESNSTTEPSFGILEFPEFFDQLGSESLEIEDFSNEIHNSSTNDNNLGKNISETTLKPETLNSFVALIIANQNKYDPKNQFENQNKKIQNNYYNGESVIQKISRRAKRDTTERSSENESLKELEGYIEVSDSPLLSFETLPDIEPYLNSNLNSTSVNEIHHLNNVERNKNRTSQATIRREHNYRKGSEYSNTNATNSTLEASIPIPYLPDPADVANLTSKDENLLLPLEPIGGGSGISLTRNNLEITDPESVADLNILARGLSAILRFYISMRDRTSEMYSGVSNMVSNYFSNNLTLNSTVSSSA